MSKQKQMSIKSIFTSLRQLDPAVGLLLIIIGVLILLTSYIAHLTSVNLIQAGAFLLILVGVVSYILLQKWQSNY